MAILSKLNAHAKTQTTSGFGTNPGSYGGRFINKDGTANVRKRGMNILSRTSWYHTMIRMPRWKFLCILFTFYALINLIFAGVYYLIGVRYLDGISASGSEWVKFGKAYFFSAQTFTTVGYGHISPTGFVTSAVAAAEALVGLLSFAIATGLFFGRFSQPVAHIKFSDNSLIAPYKDGRALMFRMAPFKNTNLTDAEGKVTMGLIVEENGVMVNKFYFLDLEMSKINALNLSWTLVHPLDEKSPLYNFSEADFKSADGEVLVFVKAFDDMFSATVSAQTSYTFDEIVYGAKFEMMYSENESNTQTILHLEKLNSFRAVELG